MRFLKDKTVVLGISGGIAAYKAADLCRLLMREGATVQVVMTAAAQKFITPLTFAALTGQPVFTAFFPDGSDSPISHIELANRADLFLVAPATANILAKLALGIADDLLSATALAISCPALVAPAMHVNMYNKDSVQSNLATLKKRNWSIIEPEEGTLACGAKGKGRLAVLGTIISACRQALAPQDFCNQDIIVTAGGTKEPLDPVRYLGNYSSGKMGYALAQAAWERGARVTLISASQLPPPVGVEFVAVQTAAEMFSAVKERFDKVNIVLKAAAVADFRPLTVAAEKIKKDPDLNNIIELGLTDDILANLGRLKKRQLLVGFAAESDALQENAREKLQAKNLDLVVANDITQEGAGFGGDTNIVTLIYPDGSAQKLPLLAKSELAHHILEAIKTLPRWTETGPEKGDSN